MKDHDAVLEEEEEEELTTTGRENHMSDDVTVVLGQLPCPLLDPYPIHNKKHVLRMPPFVMWPPPQ